MLIKIKVPRSLQLSRNVVSVSLHVFVDASQDAYGAVVYMKSEYSDGKVSVSFVTSKTKVAPLQSTSIPRLELMGAVTGKRLALSVAEALNIDKQFITFWTDSTSVLWWIKGHSRQFKPFVANRIGEIQASVSRYPIILPRKNWVTKLIVKHHHELGNHCAGTNQTLSLLSTRFWIISAREEIIEWERECAICKRRKAKVAQQIMAPLPQNRLTTSLRAFTKTAVDFGGPFMTMQGRGRPRQKRYLCLFTCLASRAIHLEMAYGLDVDSFVNTLSRMINRRGIPEEMLSDNGTNFVAANKELCELYKDPKTKAAVADKGIKWTFNPPYAPHFGGVFKIMIKSAKRAITAILKNAEVNDEELMTAFCGAEALINSRPLT